MCFHTLYILYTPHTFQASSIKSIIPSWPGELSAAVHEVDTIPRGSSHVKMCRALLGSTRVEPLGCIENMEGSSSIIDAIRVCDLMCMIYSSYFFCQGLRCCQLHPLFLSRRTGILQFLCF